MIVGVALAECVWCRSCVLCGREHVREIERSGGGGCGIETFEE